MWLAAIFYIGLGVFLLFAFFGNHNTNKLPAEEKQKAESRNLTLGIMGGILGLCAVIGLAYWGGQRNGNEWFPKNNSSLPTYSAPSQENLTQTQEISQKFWITNSTRKRHNSSCRYYGNSKGHWGGANEGIACKICGG